MNQKSLDAATARPAFSRALDLLRTGKSPAVDRMKGKLRETAQRLSRAERRADAIEKVAGDTAFLVKDRKAQKQRRGKAARQTRRDTKDSGLWNRYEAFRSIKRNLGQARKEKRRLTQLQAAQRVIDASKKSITINAESLVRYYRAWLKSPKRRIGSD